jgi:hypothetical protein
VKSARKEDSIHNNKISHNNVIDNALCTLDNYALSNEKVHNALYCNDTTVNKKVVKVICGQKMHFGIRIGWVKYPKLY